MKKILFFMFAALVFMFTALAFVSCEKEDSEVGWNDLLFDTDTDSYVKLSQFSVVFDKEKGGTITIESEKDAFVKGIMRHVGKQIDMESFYNVSPPDFIISFEQISKYKEFTTPGLKVIPDGYRKFTIVVEPNCGYDSYAIGIAKLLNTKKGKKIGGRGGGATFQVLVQ